MEQESWIIKFLPFFLLALTTVFSIVLLSLINHRFPGSFSRDVVQHRTIVAVVVQITSTLLAAAQVYILCKLINFATRIHSTRKSIRNSSLGLLTALSVPQIDWDLSWYAIIIATGFITINPLLGAVWAGALTPLVADLVREDGQIPTPYYPGPVETGWVLDPGGTISLGCGTPQWKPAINISLCPAIDHTTTLVSTAQSATHALTVPRVFPKIESPLWSYIGRSFGAGAAQGFYIPTVGMNHSYTSYSYEEPGYAAQVTCSFNETSNLTISEPQMLDLVPLVIWTVEGSLPNTESSNTSAYTLTTSDTDWWDEILAWSAASANGMNMFAIATYEGPLYEGDQVPDHWYSPWNTLQCSVDFQPTLFNVGVNVGQSLIHVTRKNSTADFEKTGSLQEVIMANLDIISRMSSNIAVSTLGEALFANAYTVRDNHPEMSYNDTLARGAENMITAIIDDLLVAEATKQITINNSTSLAGVRKRFDAVRIGSSWLIYISLGVNIALWLLLCIEAVRTRVWRNLPGFNFADLQSALAAAVLITAHRHSDESHADAQAIQLEKRLKDADVRWLRNDTKGVIIAVNLPPDLQRKTVGISDTSVDKQNHSASNTSAENEKSGANDSSLNSTTTNSSETSPYRDVTARHDQENSATTQDALNAAKADNTDNRQPLLSNTED